MKLFTCFDDAIEDGVPLGWARRWNVATNVSASHNVIRPAAAVVPVKRRVLRHIVGDGPTATPGAVSWDTAGSLADFKALMCFRADPSRTPDSFYFRFRCSGAYAAEARGYFLRAEFGVGLSFNKTVAGVDSITFLQFAAKTLTTSDSYYLRVEVATLPGSPSGTSIKARLWDTDVAEPGTWDIDATDSSITEAGWMGFQTHHPIPTSGGAATDLNFLSIATDGDTPQVPRTNAEYAAWLAAPGETLSLVEISAVGYADNGGWTGDYTKETKVFIANGGYTSKAWDVPPLQHYDAWVTKIPTFHREMGVALSGEAAVGFGSVVVSNPAGATGAGVRDDWLRMKWKRNFVKVYFGAPTWPKHDFRCFILGRLLRPKATSSGEIEFPVDDLAGVLENDVNPDKFTSGDYAGLRVPVHYGANGRGDNVLYETQVEPPLTDAATHTYTVSKRNIDSTITSSNEYLRVYDEQVPLDTGPRIVTAVSGNDQTCAAHGMLVGYEVYYTAGTPPTPLALFTRYYVAAVSAPGNVFALSATLGGAQITLTSATTGATFVGFGFHSTAGAAYESPLTIALVGNPVGRITVSGFGIVSQPRSAAPSPDLKAVYERIARDVDHLPVGWIDAQTFTVNGDVFYWVGTEKTAAREVLHRLAMGTFSWYGFSQDGFLQFGELRLPAATAVLSLIESDVEEDSLNPVREKLPVNWSTAELRRPHFFTGGPFHTGSPEALQEYVVAAPYTYPAPGLPLDDHPTLGDMGETFKGELLYTEEFTYHRTLLGKMLGTFEFETTLKAAQLSIGQTISLTHSRYGWKSYTTESVSPDNPADFDARLAVVIGIDVDLDRDAFPVKLTVFRQVPGYYPQQDTLGNYLARYILDESGEPMLAETGEPIEREGA